MLPKTMSADYKRKGNQVDESEMERSLSLEDYPVILYCHGNSYDRDFVERAKMKDVGASTRQRHECHGHRTSCSCCHRGGAEHFETQGTTRRILRR